ncbi:MAG: Ppx/GppA phosphatase family protein [Planctomycetota bacterium]|nr:Ppx/GppA phosphatase family protein [Planctomycetota bacterium]
MTAETTSKDHRTIAVIDIGATSIRMAIFQVNSTGAVRTLETLSQAVSLGKDSFLKGRIEYETIEDCVHVLKIFRSKLDEFGIVDPGDIHVVATSAVREARNRLLFIDRVFIATGFEVEPFDEAEMHRVTYLGIQPLLKTSDALQHTRNVICEIGGGSTEILVVDSGNVLYAETFRMGSLRLRKTLEAGNAPQKKLRSLMIEQIQKVVHQFKRSAPDLAQAQFVGMGGDLRFAIEQIQGEKLPKDLQCLKLEGFNDLTSRILAQMPDQLLNQYPLSLPEAEALGPALLAYQQMIESLGVKSFYVASNNMRDGLVREMLQPKGWGEEFRSQVIRYTLDLARKYHFDEVHACHVAELSQALFRQLSSEHQLDPRNELILYLAALLHECGQFISQRGYHKHSLYLIRNSDFFGLGQKDILLIGLVARYHRRAHPQPNHEGYDSLNRKDRVVVSKLAALLRVAIALNASRQQKALSVVAESGPDFVDLNIPAKEFSLEKITLQQAGTLFRETFGKRIAITEA